MADTDAHAHTYAHTPTHANALQTKLARAFLS